MIENPVNDPDHAGNISVPKKGPKVWVILLTVFCGIVLLVCFLLPPVRQFNEPPRHVQCNNNLKQIALAIYNYETTYHALPPAHTVDADGKPLHSWRTLILPFIDQQKLFERIDLSKPWNDPANIEAYETRILTFQCPSVPFQNRKDTTYLAVVGQDSCFRPDEPRRLSEIAQSHGDRLMVIEVGQNQAVHWMSPIDADEQIVMGLGSKSNQAHLKGNQAVFVNGSVRLIATDTPSSELRSWISISGNRK